MIDLKDLENLGSGLIPAAIYSDPDIYELELERIFGRTWLFLAHDSQIPKPGNYVQTYMGADPIIVVRQRDGSVKAMLNQCRHRGMRVCRTDRGTAKNFTCSFHGWSYDLAGNLINVPGEAALYHNEIDKSAWGMTPVPRVYNYKGFHFGCWSEDTPDFIEYLGDMAYYFDALADRWDGGLEFVGGANKWVVDSNWKMAAEQFASDSYHAPITHASGPGGLTDSPNAAFPPWDVPGRQFVGNGHGSGSIWAPTFPPPDVTNRPVYNEWLEANKEEVFRRIGADRAQQILSHSTIFPNFSYIMPSSSIRVWHPRGPNQIEIWSWCYVPKDAPEEVKEAIRYGTHRTFTPAGMFEADDGDNWVETQNLLQGWKARNAVLNVQMGIGHDQRDVFGQPGVTSHVFSESAGRAFFQRWSDLLRGLSWEEIARLDRERDTVKSEAAS